MTKGNDRCACGSGLKFKRCCRNKGREPETCYFCKKLEAPGVKGQYATLKETEQEVWVCQSCIDERMDDSGKLNLAMMLAMVAGFKGGKGGKVW